MPLKASVKAETDGEKKIDNSYQVRGFEGGSVSVPLRSLILCYIDKTCSKTYTSTWVFMLVMSCSV